MWRFGGIEGSVDMPGAAPSPQGSHHANYEFKLVHAVTVLVELANHVHIKLPEQHFFASLLLGNLILHYDKVSDRVRGDDHRRPNVEDRKEPL